MFLCVIYLSYVIYLILFYTFPKEIKEMHIVSSPFIPCLEHPCKLKEWNKEIAYIGEGMISLENWLFLPDAVFLLCTVGIHVFFNRISILSCLIYICSIPFPQTWLLAACCIIHGIHNVICYALLISPWIISFLSFVSLSSSWTCCVTYCCQPA